MLKTGTNRLHGGVGLEVEMVRKFEFSHDLDGLIF